jgi:hypothetical protein
MWRQIVLEHRVASDVTERGTKLRPASGPGRRVRSGHRSAPDARLWSSSTPGLVMSHWLIRWPALEPQHMAGDLSVPDPFGSPTPSNPSWGSTPERSPPRLTLPSPLPPPSPPPGASQWRLRFEVRMLSRTVEIDAAELVGHFCWWRPAGGLAGAGGGSSTPSLQCGYGRGLSPPLPSGFLPSLLFVMAQWWLESYTRHDHRPLISH